MYTSILEFKNGNVGYHVGNLQHKSDYIGDKLTHIKNFSFLSNSKTGHFGAGYYFFGKLDDALEYQKQAKRKIVMIDFTTYNLYIPNDPKEFVESVIALTQYLVELSIDDLSSQEFKTFITELTDDLNYFNININKDDVYKLTSEFVTDLINDNLKTDYIITRYLKHVGFEGIDLRNTDYDNFFIGSVLYEIKTDILEYQK